MRSLPLEAEHERLGARFAEVAGWRLPLDYGDAAREQRAVRSTAGIVDWSPHGKVRVSGPEALPFLDNLLTNDLEPLRDGRGAYAALLEHHGHVVGDLAVYRVGDEFLLETDAEAAEPVLASLQKLLVADDATIADATSDYALLGLFGPTSGEIVRKLAGTTPPGNPYDHGTARVADAGVRIARSPYFGGDGFEVWVPSGPGALAVWREIVRAGAIPFGHDAAESLRIETGRPKPRVDMDEHVLALEARLEPAISMTKGCYLGQEVVARIVHQGHVNRILVGLEVEGAQPPPPGAPVAIGGAAVGKVTSAARSEALGKIVALGYVQRAHAAPGTAVTVADRPARVAALPFVRG